MTPSNLILTNLNQNVYMPRYLPTILATEPLDSFRIRTTFNTKMKSVTPQIGDIVRVDRFGYSHVGIYVGPRSFEGSDVIHNDKSGGVVLSTLAEFSGSSPVYLHKPATGDYFEREEVANRALSLIGKEFDLLFFNCEHAANWAQSRQPESPQLQAFVVIALAIIGLVFVARKA